MEDANGEVMVVRQKPRILDFVTLDGLQLFTGCTPERFVEFMVKELIDNALDKKNVHTIEVGVIGMNEYLLLFVADDGEPKFTCESLNKILDFKSAPSSKRGVKRIQRGVLGNALQCCFGISYALWKDEDRPEYTALVKGEGCWVTALKVEDDEVYPIIKPLSNPMDVKNCTTETSLTVQNFIGSTSFDMKSLPSTVVMFKLPLFKFKNPLETVECIARVNPHVTIKYYDGQRRKCFEALTETSPPILFSNFGDVWWYGFDDFQKLAQEFKGIDVRKFLSQFKKFSSVSDVKKLLCSLKIEPAKTMGSLRKEELKSLFYEMRAKTKPTSPRALPRVGEAAFLSRGALKYALKMGLVKTQDKHMPFIIEAAAFPSIFKKPNIIECVNFTVSLYEPFSKWAWTQDNGVKVDIHDLIKKGDPMTILIHFVCPNITWLNPSKGEIANVTLFKDSLFSAVKSVRKSDSETISEKLILYWVKQIFEKMPNFRFTLRQIFYQLVAKYGYPNARNSYNRLSKILRRAREYGWINPEKIVDLTRPEYFNNPGYKTLEEYKLEKIRHMIEDFDLDRWDKQPCHVEVWIEKEALSRVILPVCQKYRVNLIVGKGYSSYTQVYKAAKRFPNGKQAIILYCGDFDPPGLHIEEKLAERLQKQLLSRKLNIKVNQLDALWKKDHHFKYLLTDLEVKRVALTYQQVEEYSLPPSPLKKAGQKHREYMRRYGDKVWELDALDPQVLIAHLEEEIKQLIDWNTWNTSEKEVEQQQNHLKQELIKTFPLYLKDNPSENKAD